MLDRDFEALRPYCLGEQETKLDAIIGCHGNVAKAAKVLGTSERYLRLTLKKVRERAATKFYSPEHGLNAPAAPGFTGRAYTQQVGPEGQIERVWYKGVADDEARHRMMLEVAEEMSADLPRLKPTKAPKVKSPHLLNTYTFSDVHVGMLARKEECGEDWNLEIAENTLTRALLHMLDRSPEADRCALVIQGDWMHADNHKPFTPKSGNLLDAEKFTPTVRVCIRILKRMVSAVLAKHKHVTLIICEGNHDPSPATWLREMFAAWCDGEKRITVDVSEQPYYVLQFGLVMLAWHHGHLKKNEELPQYFAAAYPVMWGQTVFRFADTGHNHHLKIIEHSGITLMQHPTISPRDAHAARHAYLSHRMAIARTYHSQFGEYQTNFVTPAMLEVA